MNEKIRELAQQAEFKIYENDRVGTPGIGAYISDGALEKFAELIVRECVSIVAKRKDLAIDECWTVDEAMSVAEMEIEEHFGVNDERKN